MKSKQSSETIKDRDLRPDGWQRFERAVDSAVKSGPQHRTAAKPTPAKKKTQAKRR